MKHYIIYNCISTKLDCSYIYKAKALDNNLYLKTEELAKQLIETHSDDLKLMLEVER